MATDVTSSYANRQYPLVAVIEFDYTTFTEDTVYDVLDLPAGAIITDVILQVKTAWDNSVPILRVGLTDPDPDDFLDDVSLLAEANFVTSLSSAADDAALFTGDANIITAPDTLRLEYAATSGTATAGAAVLIVKYVIADRSNENQG